MKEQKAITLIALVITIIVLLILAGVTISTLTGDNGLLQKVAISKEQSEESNEFELIKLAVQAAQVAGEGTITKNNLDNELRNNFNNGESNVYKEGWKYKGYKIEKDGTVEKWLPEQYQEVEYIQNNDISDSYILPNIDWNNCNGNIQLETTLLSKYPFGNILKIPMEKVTRLFISSWRPYIAIEQEEERQDVYTTRLWGVIAEVYPTTISVDFENGILEAKNDIQSERTTFNTTQSNATGDIIFFAVKSCLYDAKFYIDNNMVRNFIPCYSKTIVTDANNKECDSGTIGLYDIVEGKFYTNQGSGTFLKGNDL